VEYLGSISGKNLKRITREIYGQYFCKQFEGDHWEIFVGYFEEDFRENIDHYTLFVDINSQTNILKLNLKFILNLERV
jgi:ribosomal protein S17E